MMRKKQNWNWGTKDEIQFLAALGKSGRNGQRLELLRKYLQTMNWRHEWVGMHADRIREACQHFITLETELGGKQ